MSRKSDEEIQRAVEALAAVESKSPEALEAVLRRLDDGGFAAVEDARTEPLAPPPPFGPAEVVRFFVGQNMARFAVEAEVLATYPTQDSTAVLRLKLVSGAEETPEAAVGTWNVLMARARLVGADAIRDPIAAAVAELEGREAAGGFRSAAIPMLRAVLAMPQFVSE